MKFTFFKLCLSDDYFSQPIHSYKFAIKWDSYYGKSEWMSIDFANPCLWIEFSIYLEETWNKNSDLNYYLYAFNYQERFLFSFKLALVNKTIIFLEYNWES